MAAPTEEIRDSEWATLPSEVVLAVSGAVHSLGDRDKLRQVCRQWSAALTGACTSLGVRGRPPSRGSWVRRFSGLEHLHWEEPSSSLGLGRARVLRGETQTLRRLVSLRLEQATDSSLIALQRRLHLPSLKKLDISGCVSLTRVEVLSRCLPGLTSLRLAECSRLREAAVIELLRGRPTALVSLDLSGTSVTREALAELRHLPALEELSLEGCFRAAQNNGLAELQNLPGLTTLNLSRMVRAWPQLDSLRHLTALTSLNLSQNELAVTDTVLGALTDLTALTQLDLSDCDSITDVGLRLLRHLCELRVLAIDSCTQVTASGVVQEIRHLSALTSLSMRRCTGIRNQAPLRTSVFESLSDLPLLASLYIDGCESIISNGEMYLIAGIQSLTTLHLAKSPFISDGGIMSLELLPSLTAVDLSELPGFTASGLLRLMRNLPALESLRLHNCPKAATNEVFAQLNEEQCVLSLTKLDLGCNRPHLWSPISDTGLAALICCFPALSRLCLRGCIKVTDVGLENLKHLAALSYLDLRDCVGITDAGLRGGVVHIPVLKELDVRGCHRVSARGICAIERLSLKILSDNKGDILDRRLKRLGPEAGCALVSFMWFGVTAIYAGMAAWRTPVGVCRLWGRLSRLVRHKRRTPNPTVACLGFNGEVPLWLEFHFLPMAILFVIGSRQLYREMRDYLANRDRILLM